MKKTSNTIIATLLLASTICAYAGEMPAQAGSVNASINLRECKNHPNYPRDSARNEEQGTVIIRFLVSTEGKVIESVIERSSGFRALDMAAFDFISGCDKFKPGVVNGKPVEAWARVSYEWKIE